MSAMRRLLPYIVVLGLVGCVSQPLPEGFEDPNDFDQIEAAKTRISLGLTYLKNGNYSQAKFNLDKALQFAPRLADAHYSLAYYYQVVGENERAEQAYQEAMDRAPRNPDIANTYGTFLCQQGKYDKAKTYFLKAVNSDNYISTAETYENLALCSHSQGQTDDAITYLQSALNHQPSRAKSLLLLTSLYTDTQQWQPARQTLRRYEKLASVSPDTLWLSVRIEQALGNTQQAQGYGDMLIHMYPEHPYTLEYIRADRGVNPDAIQPQQGQTSSSENKVSRRISPADAVTVVDTSSQDSRVDSQNEAADSAAGQSASPAREAAIPAVDPEPEIQSQDKSDNTAGQTETLLDTDKIAEDSVVEDAVMEDAGVEDNASGDSSLIESSQQAPIPQQSAPEDVALTDTAQIDSGDDSQSQSVIPQQEASTQPSESSEQTMPVTLSEEAIPLIDGKPIYHIVKPKENLYRISLQYNVKMQRLVDWNDLDSASAITTGQRLLLVDPDTIE